MTTTTIHHRHAIAAAKERRPVTATLTDGRTITGRLVFWPNPNRHTGHTARHARIQVPSGAYLSIPTHLITIDTIDTPQESQP